MKKLIFLLSFLLIPVFLFAQDPEVPADLNDLLANLKSFFGSLAGMAGTTIFLAGVLIAALKAEKRWMKLLLGWVVALVISAISNLANFGLFAEAAFLDTLLWGIGLGVVAGSLSDIPTMKVIVELVLSLIKLKK